MSGNNTTGSSTESEAKLADEKAVNKEVFEYAFQTSRGIACGALANSLSLSMQNTTTNQYAAQTLGNTAMASTCAKILAS